jgi:beta-lactamase superfamily II metal-dependent hydrolase
LGGWMLTGDAHLDGVRRRQRFLRYYQRVAPLTNVLMLPHHGSIHNHSDLVLDAMPELIVGYAAAGPNSYGHPHDDVKDAVNGHARAHFHRVSKQRSRQLEMTVQTP